MAETMSPEIIECGEGNDPESKTVQEAQTDEGTDAEYIRSGDTSTRTASSTADNNNELELLPTSSLNERPHNGDTSPNKDQTIINDNFDNQSTTCISHRIEVSPHVEQGEQELISLQESENHVDDIQDEAGTDREEDSNSATESRQYSLDANDDGSQTGEVSDQGTMFQDFGKKQERANDQTIMGDAQNAPVLNYGERTEKQKDDTDSFSDDGRTRNSEGLMKCTTEEVAVSSPNFEVSSLTKSEKDNEGGVTAEKELEGISDGIASFRTECNSTIIINGSIAVNEMTSAEGTHWVQPSISNEEFDANFEDDKGTEEESINVDEVDAFVAESDILLEGSRGTSVMANMLQGFLKENQYLDDKPLIQERELQEAMGEIDSDKNDAKPQTASEPSSTSNYETISNENKYQEEDMEHDVADSDDESTSKKHPSEENMMASHRLDARISSDNGTETDWLTKLSRTDSCNIGMVHGEEFQANSRMSNSSVDVQDEYRTDMNITVSTSDQTIHEIIETHTRRVDSREAFDSDFKISKITNTSDRFAADIDQEVTASIFSAESKNGTGGMAIADYSRVAESNNQVRLITNITWKGDIETSVSDKQKGKRSDRKTSEIARDIMTSTEKEEMLEKQMTSAIEEEGITCTSRHLIVSRSTRKSEVTGTQRDRGLKSDSDDINEENIAATVSNFDSTLFEGNAEMRSRFKEETSESRWLGKGTPKQRTGVHLKASSSVSEVKSSFIQRHHYKLVLEAEVDFDLSSPRRLWCRFYSGCLPFWLLLVFLIFCTSMIYTYMEECGCMFQNNHIHSMDISLRYNGGAPPL